MVDQLTGHAGGYFGSTQHLAWISEGNSPEVVLPVGDRSRSLALMEQSGMASLARSAGGPAAGKGGATFNITFTGPVANEFVANQVIAAIEKKARQRGLTLSSGFG
jgi:hypothetical protein